MLLGAVERRDAVGREDIALLLCPLYFRGAKQWDGGFGVVEIVCDEERFEGWISRGMQRAALSC
jgi:hypothetical protein